MKSKYLILLVIFFISTLISAQKHQDKQTISLSTAQLNSLNIYNMEGGVNVKGVEGNVATLTITRRIESSSRERLAMAKEEIYIDSLSENGNLYYFIEAPNLNFQIDEDGDGGYNNWNTGNSDSKLQHYKLKYSFQWEVSVPKNLAIHIHNHKEPLKIQNMQSRVVARNHHDGVELIGMRSDVTARSHHGDVIVSFDRNPENEIICNTHHGDIKIYVQDGFSGDVSMKSYHGAFYTDFDGRKLPPTVEINKDKNRKTHYKLGERNHYRIGNGGIKLEFKTHHGDVYVTRA